MTYTLVTNNPLVKSEYEGKSTILVIEFVESDNCMKVLETARNLLHVGKRLETHPMAGSVKPNQNPYKSVLLSDGKNDSDEQNEQILIIENAIMTCRGFLEKKKLPNWEDRYLEDFKFVDKSLIESALQQIIR